MTDVKNLWLAASLLALVACGGGGGNNEPLPLPNLDPVAVAPDDFSAVVSSAVSLDGSASSDDLSISSYLWQQVSGESVSLTSADSAIASFTAPATIGEILVFQLTVTDSAGASASDTVTVTTVIQPAEVTLSGRVTFDKVPHNTSTNGLDHASTTQDSVRGATIELLNSTATSTLQTASTDASGNYSFVVIPSTSYVLRVKAEMQKTDAAPTWDFKVVDNTSSQALYAMQSEVIAVAAASKTHNLNAGSGWGGAGYTGSRVAAPFAILDSVYQAKQKILAVDPSVQMQALKLNWSVNNVAVVGNPAIGQITTSHFIGTDIFLLGDANSDTDEYDDHVVVHEWGHYFEAFFSRSDSIGSSHNKGDKLDPRVAMGEGWGNALSGMVTDDPIYRDSSGENQSGGFDIDVEANPSGSNKGWFSEFSVHSLLYDLYDASADGSDTISLGFAPLYQALIGGEKTTPAFTTIYSMMTALKAATPENSSAITSLLASQSIVVNDDYASGETNNGGNSQHLPIYTSITSNGSPLELCFHGNNGEYNRLGNRKYLKLTIASSGSFQFTATGKADGDDPEFKLYRSGTLIAKGDAEGNEQVSAQLSAGDYVIDAYDYGNMQGARIACMNFSISAN